MLQPTKDKAKSYDDNFLDVVAQSDLYKKWSTPTNQKLATTNAFNSEIHTADIDTSNQDNLTEGINPYLNQFVDLEAADPFNEIRAVNQSWSSKALTGIGRASVKAAAEIAKMPGVVGGLIAAPFAEEGQGMETAFNNEWIKSINKLNEDINTDLLPVYVKKAVSEGNLWDNISSVDFWATDGADGIGFIASMLVPGAALKSLGIGEKILGTTAKGLSLINGESKLAGATSALTELGITAEGIDLTATTLGNTLFEAGSEAGSAMDNFQKDLDSRFQSGLINQEEYDSLSQQKGKLGRDIFLSNVVILLGPNAIQSKMIWGKAGAKQLTKELAPSIANKLTNRVKNIALATGSEGLFEEGLQSTVENMFSNSAKKGQLTDNPIDDFNVGELTEGYLDTISSTEGQKAIFLGGFLGGGMSAYHGAKSDIANRNATNQILSLAETQVNNFNTIRETDPYVRDESGNITVDANNNPVYDPVKVDKIAKSLKFTEDQSKGFDLAVQEGNEELVQQYKNQAVDQLIIPFITQGDVGIQALQQYLEETSQDPNIQANNKNNEVTKLNNSIVDKAKYLQNQYQSYKDFSSNLINLQNNNATQEDFNDFYNGLADTYLNYKAEEYSQKQILNELNNTRNNLLKELKGNENVRTDEIVDETAVEDIFKYRYETDPRVKFLNEKIKDVNTKLKNIDKLVNQDIWNSEEVNKAFDIKVKANNNIRENNTPENIAKVEEEIQAVNSATTEDQIDEIPITNPVVKKQAEVKKQEIQQVQLQNEIVEREEAVQQEIIENPIVVTNEEISSTEASEYTEDILPTQASNNALEELNSIQTGDIDNGKGVKVISTNKDTGEPLDFITQQFPNYVQYEREPVDKTNRPVEFEINQNPGKASIEVNQALEAFNKKDFSNTKLLYDYLPITVKFTDEIKAPIETRRRTGDINIPTELLRIEIISKLIDGYSIEDIKGSIQGQYKGLLKVDDGIPENSILQLDAVNNNLTYLRDNLYVVNAQGLLQNIQSGKTQAFNNPFTKTSDRTKENAKGEIYLTIPQANGQLFPLKLNVKKISDSNAIILFEIYKSILTSNKSFNTTINELDQYLKQAILENLNPELEIIGGTKEDIKIGDIVDLMIYSNTTNIKSQMRINNGVLYFGNEVATVDNIDTQRSSIINFLTTRKRHQIKIAPKSETDNTKTNLKSNSADYLKYLVNNKILNTNAVVNQPTFQGYTNIYLNPAVSLNENAQRQVNVSDKGAETPSDNFTGLFQPIQADSGADFVDNVRNSENNFVSLSEIPGTMENTQVNEVQREVYEVPTNPRDRQEDIKRLVSLIKKMQSGKELRENELKDFNKYKFAYPQEFEKRCK